MNDITGKRFGDLIAIKPIYSEGLRNENVIWKCECLCGSPNCEGTVYRRRGQLTRNCRADSVQRCNHYSLSPTKTARHAAVTRLKNNTVQSNNTSGHTGVKLENNAWTASIDFRNKRFHVGGLDFETAIRTRKCLESIAKHASNID